MRFCVDVWAGTIHPAFAKLGKFYQYTMVGGICHVMDVASLKIFGWPSADSGRILYRLLMMYLKGNQTLLDAGAYGFSTIGDV
jgi:hypothetical protein